MKDFCGIVRGFFFARFLAFQPPLEISFLFSTRVLKLTLRHVIEKKLVENNYQKIEYQINFILCKYLKKERNK